MNDENIKIFKERAILTPSEMTNQNSCKSFFSQLLASIKNSYRKDPKPLQGRMEELPEHSQKMVEQILSLKKSFEENADTELLTLIKNSIEPLIREIQKLQKASLSENGLQKKYNDWEKKAKLCLSLQDKKENNTAVIETIALLLISGIKENIEKDLNVIKNYQKQCFSDLKLSPDEQKQISSEMQQSVIKHTEALSQLKNVTPPMNVQEINLWKAHIDKTRSILFAEAIQAIETAIYS